MTKPLATFLHCHSSFAPGGKELRCARLIDALGAGVAHHIVSGERDSTQAIAAVSPQRDARLIDDFPDLKGWPTLGRLARIARALKPYDLVLTYNWGAIDVVMARTLFADAMELPPLIHHEDGFNEDEVERRKWRRNFYRKLALAGAQALVVPSQTLESIALKEWEQPRARVHRIPNGIDTSAFAKRPRRDSLRIVKRRGEFWVGTLAGLRAVKALPALVRAFAPLPEAWHLVILGEGEEREAIVEQARALEISHRVHLAGHIRDPETAIGLFDVFALSSRSEQFPISVAEAMAAGLPVAAFDVGDVANMVSAPNRPFIVARGDEAALAQALRALADDKPLRRQIGEANRDKAREFFDFKRMVESYRDLYSSALGRPI